MLGALGGLGRHGGRQHGSRVCSPLNLFAFESIAKVLSERSRELLATIAREKPASLTEFAKLAGRNKSDLSRMLETMSLRTGRADG